MGQTFVLHEAVLAGRSNGLLIQTLCVEFPAFDAGYFRRHQCVLVAVLRKTQALEANAERRREAASLEQRKIARSAKNAAWLAAAAAIIAATCAAIVIPIALIKP
jgi:hypothetical protein